MMDWDLVREVVERWVRRSAERVTDRRPDVMFLCSRAYVSEKMPLIVGVVFGHRSPNGQTRRPGGLQCDADRVLYQLCISQEENGSIGRFVVHGELCDRITMEVFYAGPECTREARRDQFAVLGTVAAVIKELDKKVDEVLAKELVQEMK